MFLYVCNENQDFDSLVCFSLLAQVTDPLSFVYITIFTVFNYTIIQLHNLTICICTVDRVCHCGPAACALAKRCGASDSMFERAETPNRQRPEQVISRAIACNDAGTIFVRVERFPWRSKRLPQPRKLLYCWLARVTLIALRASHMVLYRWASGSFSKFREVMSKKEWSRISAAVRTVLMFIAFPQKILALSLFD